MRTITLAAAMAGLVACSQATPTPSAAPPAASAAADSTALVVALTPVLFGNIGQPVRLEVRTARTEGDWGWLVVHPVTPAGAAIDWSTTPYAQNAEEGVLDGDGETTALLQRQNGQWTVREHVVGPTDVAYTEWPTRYGAPAC